MLAPYVPSRSMQIVKKDVDRHPDSRAKVVVALFVQFLLWWKLIGFLVDASSVLVALTDGELQELQYECPTSGKCVSSYHNKVHVARPQEKSPQTDTATDIVFVPYHLK